MTDDSGWLDSAEPRRRDVLKKIAVGGAAPWVAPTLASQTAGAQGTAPTPSNRIDGATNTTVTTITVGNQVFGVGALP